MQQRRGRFVTWCLLWQVAWMDGCDIEQLQSRMSGGSYALFYMLNVHLTCMASRDSRVLNTLVCSLVCSTPFCPLYSSDKSCSTLISALPRLYVQLQGIAWWLFGSSDAEHAQETHCVFVSDEFILAPTKEECYVVKFSERYQFCFVGD